MDGALKRPLLYYADPAMPHARKQAFDVGEYGLGYCANSLSLGCDCLGTITYFDAIISDINGDPMVIPDCICLHEEDAGVLAKHTDYRNGKAYTIRSRRLVVSQMVTGEFQAFLRSKTQKSTPDLQHLLI
jgi:primary-amine oxidase